VGDVGIGEPVIVRLVAARLLDAAVQGPQLAGPAGGQGAGLDDGEAGLGIAGQAAGHGDGVVAAGIVGQHDLVGARIALLDEAGERERDGCRFIARRHDGDDRGPGRERFGIERRPLIGAPEAVPANQEGEPDDDGEKSERQEHENCLAPKP
jgi:hypothetical protein